MTDETKPEQRRSEIMRILIDAGTIHTKDLAERLGVSHMTIHRDLTDLQERGYVRRIRGEVSAEKSVLFESSYLFRSRQHTDEKRRVARAAIRHVEPGNAIIWDDSSTTYQIAEYLDRVTPVTVITNALPVIQRLSDMADVDLIALGGRYNKSYNGFFGIACEKAIRSYHVDVALMSTTTVQGLSLYTQDEQVVRAKQAMIAAARRRILLVDSSKFTFTALNYVAEITDFDLVILPSEVDPAAVDRMRAAGVTVEVV
jgi:DeoR/GlpR family transcriptional regulator of sugar metabolism